MTRSGTRASRADRVILFLVGAVLTAAAVVLGLLSLDRIASISNWAHGRSAVLSPEIDRSLHAHALAYRLGAVGISTVLIVLGALWLLRQLPLRRPDADHPVENPLEDTVPGANFVRARALAGALENDLARYDPIANATAELDLNRNRIHLRIDTYATAALPEVKTGVIDPAVDRLVTVAQLTDPDVDTDVRFVTPRRELA